MLSSAPRQISQPQRPATRIPTVCVVDPQSGDYQGWESLAEANGVRLRIVATAEDALRLARTAAVDLWVVNTELPSLSGYELCSMLKARSSAAPVYLVVNDYSPAAEQAAWNVRSTLFGCKGAHATWLGEWLRARSVGHFSCAAKRPHPALSSQ